MSSESVQTLKVSDFAKVKGGKRMPAGTALSQQKSQHPYLRIVDFKDGGIDKSNLQYVPDEVFPQIARYVISDRDLYISIVGTIGLVGAVPKELNGANLTENAAKICDIDESKVNAKYLGYYLRSEVGQAAIRSLTVGSTQPKLALFRIDQIEVPCPPLAEQRGIAALLAALDDRIALLRETNATLEAIAQALFKSWFVDFDPVRAKMEGRAPEGMDEATAALFPDALEESELGWVPKGWEVISLGSVCSTTIGGLWGKDTQEEPDLVPAVSLRGVDLEHLRLTGFAKNAPIRWVKPSAMSKRRLTQTEVLIASSGAGPCGRPLWAGADFEAIYGLPVIFSNFVKRLECGTPAQAIFVDRVLAEMRETKEIWNYINGTSIPNLDDKLLLSTKKMALPCAAVLAAFEEIVKAIYLITYSEQAQTLANLRDTLLPRLISGQLRLPDAQALAAEV